MGLSKQAFRMLKSRWDDVQIFAEEMYLVLLTDQDSTQAPTSVHQADGTDPTRLPPELSTDPLPQLNLPVLDFPVFPDNPFAVEQSPNQSSQPDTTNFRQQRSQEETTTQHTRVVIPGQVGSGSGGRYNVTLYPNSSQDSSTQAIATSPDPAGSGVVGGVKQLDGSTDVERGTWALIFRHTEWEIKTLRVVETGGGLQGEKEISKSVEIRVVARHHEMQAPVAQATGGGVPTVITGGGPGDTYQALAYPLGTDQVGVAITVKILQIDPAETIPVGTWLIATLVAGRYYGQIAVWL